MKKYFFLLAANLMLAFSAPAQMGILDGVYLESDEEVVARIESIKADIDAHLSSYTKIEKAKDSLGYRYAYYKGNELKKIKAFHKNQDNFQSASWYFQNGKVILAVSILTDAPEKTIFNSEKLYFDNEQLTVWIVAGKPIDKNSNYFKRTASTMPANFSKLKEQYAK